MMTDKAEIPIRNVTGLHEPNETVIAHIEKLLTHAKSGALRSMVEVVEWDDGSVGNGVCLSKHAQQRRMLGELQVLIVKWATDLQGETP